MLNLYKKTTAVFIITLGALLAGCRVPALVETPKPARPPAAYSGQTDTANSATLDWQRFFNDKYLEKLIDTALLRNQELLVTLREIDIARNDIRVRKGLLYPSVGGFAGAGIDKPGRYTSQGAGDASTDMTPGKKVPEWLPDFATGFSAQWEADIWKKLHNQKAAATARYLATAEGKNFVVTNLIAEIANRYYELLALDDQLTIVQQTITLQKDALEVVKAQKQAARVTELAVKKFEAEVLSSESLEFSIRQQISENENEINFLLGRFPQPVERETRSILSLSLQPVMAGLPAQLLDNRPDIRQAGLELEAARLDLKAARAEFYPRLDITAVLGINAFKPGYLTHLPESLLFSAAGDLAGPLINKNGIKAEYSNANARQLQALYNYDKTVLNACLDVSTQLSAIQNLQKAYNLKTKETETLIQSVDVSNELFRSGRADYFEVLMTQRDALQSKLELIETRLRQFNATVAIYRGLGGGWK